jgi:acetylglutamate kinase
MPSACPVSTAACSSPSGSRRSASSPASLACAAICSTRSCNVNADDAAAGIAAGIGARQLVLLTDVDGVRDAEGRRLDTLTVGEAEALIDSGVINGGMVPKIRAALAAVTWEGSEAIIADSAADRALERSLSEPTFGTRITATRAANVGAA